MLNKEDIKILIGADNKNDNSLRGLVESVGNNNPTE
jgi:hypothetical protein